MYLCPVCRKDLKFKFREVVSGSYDYRTAESYDVTFYCPTRCFRQGVKKNINKIYFNIIASSNDQPIILNVDRSLLPEYIIKFLDLRLVLDAFNTFHSDFIEGVSYEHDPEFIVEYEMYYSIERAHIILSHQSFNNHNFALINEINWDNAGDVLDILDYYIQVRGEDLDGSADYERVLQTKIELPIMKKMVNNLKELNIPSFRPHRTISVFKVNNFISLRLINNETIIFVKNKKFLQCSYLLLNIASQDIPDLDVIESIDEASEFLDNTLERTRVSIFNIEPEQEFQGHCSNLQVWAENNYNSCLLHSNLAFPLLKKLSEVGDPQARLVFKDEIIIRLKSNYENVIIYLITEGFLEIFSNNELDILIEDAQIDYKFRYWIKCVKSLKIPHYYINFDDTEKAVRIALCYFVVENMYYGFFIGINRASMIKTNYFTFDKDFKGSFFNYNDIDERAQIEQLILHESHQKTYSFLDTREKCELDLINLREFSKFVDIDSRSTAIYEENIIDEKVLDFFRGLWNLDLNF